MGDARLELGDIERAIASFDPQLGDMLVRYLGQDDADDGHAELVSSDDFDAPYIEVPASAYTLHKLRSAVGTQGRAGKTATEMKGVRRDAFATAEASMFAPPRLRLGKILLSVYERGDEAGRSALIHAFAHGRMQWGVWQAAKSIYKLAEDRHDIAMFGVLAYRFDAMTTTPHREIGTGTLVYLRRRAWRYLRQMGATVPDLYPTFVVEVLRHYPDSYARHQPSWIAAQVWGHTQMIGARGSWSFGLPNGDVMATRAFPDAWKVSPTPLLRLLDAAVNDIVCSFAIRCLRADHPLTLRAVEPAWLIRLGKRPVAAIHSFVVALLKDSPELHQSRLRELGLHDVVMSFLRSPAADARAYALDYAAAHGGDLAIDDLVELIEAGAAEVKKFAAARLEQVSATDLGLPRLLRLLGNEAVPWLPAKIAQGFSPQQIDAAAFVDVAARGGPALHALIKIYGDARATIPATHWTTLVDDRRFSPSEHARRQSVATAMSELAKRSAHEIGIDWIQRSLEDRARTDAVTRWLDAGMLSGPDLDVDWLKTLVGKPRLKPLALRLLGDRKRVAPARIGLSWLLEATRSSDTALQTFAQRMLLESFEPEDFADGNRAAGVARLWELATGAKQPETVRTFAATYLKAHHPDLGPRSPEARSLGIQPRLDHDAYPLATVRPLFDDARADVRRLAAAIAGEEIIRWNHPELVYALAASQHREGRALGAELLLGVLAETGRRVPESWLDGARMFQLAETAHKASREVALTLIRRLYERLGGAERLAWLMESPDRDVRLFAVRLFWDRHRPKPWPDDYTPRKQTGAAIGTARFSDLAALRQFARVVLFGLPPGRVGERDPVVAGAPVPERALPASVAKKRLIEAMRDLGLEDVDFARAIAPVLGEFTHSTAKGEWQASLQALTALRAHHHDLLESA